MRQAGRNPRELKVLLLLRRTPHLRPTSPVMDKIDRSLIDRDCQLPSLFRTWQNWLWRWITEGQISFCLGYRRNKEFSSLQIFTPMLRGVQDHKPNLELSLREPESLAGREHACPLPVLLHTRMTCRSGSFRPCSHPPGFRGEHLTQPRHRSFLHRQPSRSDSAHVVAMGTFLCLCSIRAAAYSYSS